MAPAQHSTGTYVKPFSTFPAEGEVTGDSQSVTCIAYSTSHDILYSGSRDGSILIRTFPYLNPGAHPLSSKRIAAHDGSVVFIEVIPGACELLVSIGVNGDVKLWEFRKTCLAHLKTMSGFNTIVNPLTLISPVPVSEQAKTASGRATETSEYRYLIFVSVDGALNLWNLDDNSCVSVVIHGIDNSLITGLAVCGPENLMAIGTASGAVKLFDILTFREVGELLMGGAVTHLTFAIQADDQRGYMLAAAASNEIGIEVEIWRLLKGTWSSVYSHTEETAIQEISAVDANIFFITYWNCGTAKLDIRYQRDVLQVEETYQVPTARSRADAQLSSSLVIPMYHPWETLLVTGFTNAELLISIVEYQVPQKNPIETKYVVTGRGSSSQNAWKRGRWEQTTGEELLSQLSRGHKAFEMLPAEVEKLFDLTENKPKNHRLKLLPDQWDNADFISNSAESYTGGPDLNKIDRNMAVTTYAMAPWNDNGDSEFGSTIHRSTANKNTSRDRQDLAASWQAARIEQRLARSRNGEILSRVNLKTETEKDPEAHRYHTEGRPVPCWLTRPSFRATDYARQSVTSSMPATHERKANIATSLATKIASAIYLQDTTLQPDIIRTVWVAGAETNNLKRSKMFDSKRESFQNDISTVHRAERSNDTVAVGISESAKEITIAANVKRRIIGQQIAPEIGSPTKYGISYTVPEGGYGLREELHTQIIATVMAAHPETAGYTFRVIGPQEAATSHETNAAPHAEMQLLKDSLTRFPKGKAPIIGVSKPPCTPCRTQLNSNTVLTRPACTADKTVRNHTALEHIGTREIVRGPKRQEKGFGLDRTPVMCSEIGTKAVKSHSGIGEHGETRNAITQRIQWKTSQVTTHKPDISKDSIARHVRSQVHGRKARATGGLGAMIENVVENYDREGFAESTDTPSTDAGTYQTRSTVGAYARAGTVEARACWNILEASAAGPNVAAGAHAGPSGLTVYAKAEVARVEASGAGIVIGAGLNVSTGASIGIDGLDVSVAGFGVSIGPRMAVRLPIIDISCTIM